MYPALAVVAWLTSRNSQGTLPQEQLSAICWVGSTGGVEETLVRGAGVPFEGISAGGLRGKSPLDLARGLFKLARGFWQARRLVSVFKPDVLFVTGGYVCGPVVLAGWLARVPILIYLPDVEPGLAIKSLARFARRVAVTAQASVRFFRPGQAMVTGYPVRRDLFESDRAESRQRLGLTATHVQGGDLPVLLVFGGSQGAHSINQAVCDGILGLLSVAQVVHLTGRRDVEQVRARRASLSKEAGSRYHVYDYLDKEMVDALRAADLVVARAGASTLGELPAAGVPGVLVPYPYAGAHQWANARHLAEAGAAVTVSDSEVGTQLVPTVLGLLADVDRRAAMSQAARALARPDAAECIAHELRELAS